MPTLSTTARIMTYIMLEKLASIIAGAEGRDWRAKSSWRKLFKAQWKAAAGPLAGATLESSSH
jgi:hypothetical protein